MNHPCPRYEPELSAYIDAETPPERRAEIETHLRACEPCRLAVARLRGVSRTLRRWDAQETRYATSTGFRNRVFAKLGAEEGAPPANFAWRAAAAVALVAVGATGFALVAPRLGGGDDVGLGRLEDQVARLEAVVRSRPISARSADGAQPPAAAAGVERVEPIEPVVAPVAADDASGAPESAPDVYEQRGGRSFLREALPDHEDYARERDKLGLLEELRKMQAIQAEKASQPDRTTQAAPAPSPLATFLGELRVSSGTFAAFENVQVWPIESTGARASDGVRPVACENAIKQRILNVTESTARELVVVENVDPKKRPVLILAGDVLVGGRQDRVAREDALIGAGDQMSIPTYGSGGVRKTRYTHFTSCSGLAPQALRALVAADRALLAGGLTEDRFDDYVADTVKSLSSPQRLGSLDNLFSNPELIAATDRYAKSFDKDRRLDAPNVVGFAVSAGSRLLGAEVFGDHATFLEHRARLLRSYVLAAIAASPDGTRLDGAPPSRDDVVALVASSPKSVFHGGTSSGYGTLAVFRGVEGYPFGFGLLDGNHVVHAALFTSVPAGPDPAGVGHAGGSHRGGTDAPSGPEGTHSGGSRSGSSGGGDGATDSK